MAKLSKKDKLAIVRGIIIRRPDYRQYGFNRSIIKQVRDKFGVEMTDRDISGYISDIEKQWKADTDELVSKRQLIDMFKNIYEKDDSRVWDKIKSLQEIGKLEGHYVEIIDMKDKEPIIVTEKEKEMLEKLKKKNEKRTDKTD